MSILTSKLQADLENKSLERSIIESEINDNNLLENILDILIEEEIDMITLKEFLEDVAPEVPVSDPKIDSMQFFNQDPMKSHNDNDLIDSLDPDRRPITTQSMYTSENYYPGRGGLNFFENKSVIPDSVITPDMDPMSSPYYSADDDKGDWYSNNDILGDKAALASQGVYGDSSLEDDDDERAEYYNNYSIGDMEASYEDESDIDDAEGW